MKTTICLVLVLLLSLQACKKEPKETKEITRMERVMAVHDEFMPKMSTLGKLISALEPKIDSTAAGMKYKVAKDSLVASYDYMMDWMKGFGDRFDSEEIMDGKALTPEKETWLLEEEEKVNTMKDKMLQSIANAQALLPKEE